MADSKHRRRAPWAPALAAIVATGTAAAEPAQDPQYPLLVNRFGELCTMCEAMVACRAGDAAPADVAALQTGPYTLYHFQTRTFWGQVSTIFTYLQRWIAPVVYQERPVVIYTVDGEGPAGASRSRADGTTGLSLDPARIIMGDRQIDRSTSIWQDRDGQPAGSCARLPLRATLTFLKAHEPWPAAMPSRAE
ncbi:MAG: hypothetical protein JNM50_02140 [Chromatiales bacterium]|jgi:hypothetical protein|nr:hypothetical protein [Chromatiales bacterium]